MRNAVLHNILTMARSYVDLAESLPDEAFGLSLGVRSNHIGGQFWCVIGARESYTRAIADDHWDSFSCSLSEPDTYDKTELIAGLRRSYEEFEEMCEGVEWTPSREHFLVGLLEHEAQHQGQLIRFCYALGYQFPQSWVERWALST